MANDRDMLRAARLPILIEVARLNIVAGIIMSCDDG